MRITYSVCYFFYFLTYNEVVKSMKKWIIIIICLLSLLIVSMTSLYVRLIPSIKQYGKMEVERFNQLIISHCYFTDDSQYDDLVIIERDDEKNLQLIDFDMVKVNKLVTAIVLDIENTYASIEEGRYQAIDDSYYQRRMKEVSQNGIISKVSDKVQIDKLAKYYYIFHFFIQFSLQFLFDINTFQVLVAP